MNLIVMIVEESSLCGFNGPMLTEIYIEALLVDEETADQVWDLWNVGVIPNDLAAWAWLRIATRVQANCFATRKSIFIPYNEKLH